VHVTDSAPKSKELLKNIEEKGEKLPSKDVTIPTAV